MSTKYVYTFGDGKAEGKADMKNLLGGKGANLAEMNLIGVPVPAGFTITTEVCTDYNNLGKDAVVAMIKEQVEAAVKDTEVAMNAKFDAKDGSFPLLVSVRSGARASMPGMMNTVLNLGMNDDTVKIVAEKSGNEKFAYDSYRRFIHMYGDVVMGVEAEEGHHNPFEVVLDELKAAKGYKVDTELTVEDLKNLVEGYKAVVREHAGVDFPTNPWDQLWGSVCAVFDSWNTERAILYRKMENIPSEWGTAVNVQAMVYGNMGDTSATGVCFSRDAATGEDQFNGEYLINAQGEDVVSGVRTPLEITKVGSLRWAERNGTSEEVRQAEFLSMEEAMPELYNELNTIQQKLEDHYSDMQDMEFTIQDGKLWMLQTRNGKRTGAAMVKMAVDMLAQGMIDEKTAILRQEPNKLDELLHPVFEQSAIDAAKELSKGLPASPGAATGQIVFSAEVAEEWAAAGKKVILVRRETSPEDLKGMYAAEGILTERGGMTSHAAVVARGMGKCCISSAAGVLVTGKSMTINGVDFKEGDFISLNGTTGKVYEGKVATITPSLDGDFGKLMDVAENNTRMYVRTNADTPADAKAAREFGAKGIGLCRTEHMFFEGDKIWKMREMILAENVEGRKAALAKLLPVQREDFSGILGAMDGFGVTIRLLDPPLHEFTPNDEASQIEMAEKLGIDVSIVKAKVESLHEFNPMLGHRGCRLGNTYPEITEMQARAIIEAACDLKAKGKDPKPEIMVPLIGTLKEFQMQEAIIRETAAAVFAEKGVKVDFLVGTMIEIPRAALTADAIAEYAEFFSFGTNDLTQMGFGYSRDDAGKFLPIYIEKGILKNDPFQVLDQEGIGQLVRMGCEKGKSTRPDIKLGICGEHGGEPSSVEFCNSVGMDYVSCSPFRVPIARLAAAQANLKQN
ncbi:pyruvate, phosphate dikinase [Labilibaculum sp. A4]|uniref:Pyruvate, phosphate dikinase n=1 Tax=Labilibaculum euxinus TaxID=2686357 RepID=A0A425YH84_9BACT|nr:pyruvate, phosphate dikinase [Labilibaculum euxinus]MDQ1769555.1 pyruvate, phosphate dikinase [Labilibaculum euxinus]MUP36299.1 pyruvate, phosphate dikinase [Labilibaculum euxinus]MVB05504.1 pyruvate, phosphate dikinase [Labilibaculum euxinus]MWN75080.1 pyruvate, phosphate dikinase [Labilibaculum euxinus]